MQADRSAERRPSLGMWLTEGAVFLGVTVVVAVATGLLVGWAAGRQPVVDGGAVLFATVVGLLAARRFRRWNLQR